MHFYFQLVEYVALRLIRRFLFTYNTLLKIGKIVPHYGVNSNQSHAVELVDAYEQLVRKYAPDVLTLDNCRILEIGAGVTDTVGLLLAERFTCEVHVCDPYVDFDADGTAAAIQQFGITPEARNRTKRVREPLTNGYDLILSNSVLEHVEHPTQFFGQMKIAIRERGRMIHRVDYRDHFFKYPYHFLMFSDFVWNTFLNPGDLYRWRLDDHLESISACGFDPNVTETTTIPAEYAKIQIRMQSRFTSMKHNDVATGTIVAC